MQQRTTDAKAMNRGVRDSSRVCFRHGGVACARGTVIGLVVLSLAANGSFAQGRIEALDAEAVRSDVGSNTERETGHVTATPEGRRGRSPGGMRVVRDLFVPVAGTPNAIVTEVRHEILNESARRGQDLLVERFPLTAALAVDLELTPFSVISEESRFVAGQIGGPDRPLPFDPSRVTFFHGTVSGRDGSSVYLSFSDLAATGYIDLGRGATRYRISERDGTGATLGQGMVSVFSTQGGAGAPGGVPLCGVEGDKLYGPDGWMENPLPLPEPDAVTAAQGAAAVGRKHFELAVETDYEYFILFHDLDAALIYLLQTYGEVGAIFLRDINVHFEVVFARLWDNPNDLFNGPSPLFQFWPYWRANVRDVPRDAAQLFSGRRDYPFGGQAFLNALCSLDFGFGIVGYVQGFQPDPTRPSPYNWDVSVSAHELGHTFGARHTHDLGLDTCHNPNTTPQRGSIMSYCGQTWSGMKANTDNFFHVANRQEMIGHVNNSPCVVPDCNMNFVADSIDIAGGASADVNGNGIPDECEDCNDNTVLDPQDIASGTSMDVNGNGIPDECEPDCNNNGVPDDRDIALGNSQDGQGDGIPDECDEDCNNNSVSDYMEIMADMTLDKNRNALLDSCEDCDGDGTDDLTQLAGAHDLWVASGLSNQPLRRFHSTAGVLMNATAGAAVNEGQDVVILPSGLVLVSSAADHRVRAFDPDGTFVTDFVSAGSGGLDHPAGMAVHPSGDLLVASRNTDNVLRYNGTSGAFVGVFVAAGSGGLIRPFGLAYGPNGHLFVTSDDRRVLEYNGVSGAFVRELVSASNNGGLGGARGLAFKPDGNLLVASFGTDEVLEYDGRTGWPRGKWAQVGTETAITQDSPWGVRVGPNGHVYVTRTGSDFSSGGSFAGDQDDIPASHLTDARMFEYDVCTGDHRNTLIGGNDHGLNFATGFAFLPGFDVDCNFNQLPDNCDIDSGVSLDTNDNDIPDECELDCNNNGVFDRLDLWPRGDTLDCNCNGIPDECDVASGLSADCNSNDIPDECESLFDCDENGVPDICDVAFGDGTDCRQNDFLDACEVAIPEGGLLFSEDFEAGLPAGWTATGIFQVTNQCLSAPTCNGSWAAYAGDTASCTYGDAQAGAIVSPPILLPPNARVELRYCSALQSEVGFDFADVVINNTRVLRESGGDGSWQDRTIDLTPFAGREVTLLFRFEADGSVSGGLGWQVDDIQVLTEAGAPDCNDNLIPDDCDLAEGASRDCNINALPDECDIASGFSEDLDDNGVPDECETCAPASAAQPDPQGPKNRYLSFTAGDLGRTQAARVTFTSLPPPFSSLNGTTLWVGQPVRVSKRANKGIGDPVPPGEPSVWMAPLECNPVYVNWSLYDKVHGHHPAIVPGATYTIELLDEFCEPAPENFSSPLAVETSVWGDVVGPFSSDPPEPGWTPSDGLVNVTNDLLSMIDAFLGLPTGPGKGRADLSGFDSPAVDGAVLIGDILRGVDAVLGKPYPFEAVVDCPASSAQ